MADYTENYNLKKPSPEDFVNIADINGNMDLIDEALKTHTHDTATTTKNGFMSAGQVKQLALRATKTELENHVNNNGVHVTAAEKESWNGKADGAHTHEVATTTKNGFMSKEQVVELAAKADKSYVDETILAKAAEIVDAANTITFNNFSTGNILQKRINQAYLSVSRYSMATATVGHHALFAGGNNVFTYYDKVDGYTESLTRKAVTVLSQGRCNLAATVVNGSALFAGGMDTSDTYSNVVNAYNESLTMTTITALSTAREGAAAASVGNYALFAGGNNEAPLNTVDAYNASLTRSTPTALSQKRNGLAAATIGSYALFAGGSFYNKGPTTYFDIVDAYNTSLTRTLASSLSAERWQLGNTVIGGYALFAGGSGNSAVGNIVDAYTVSLTRSTPTVLSTKMSNVIGVTVGTHALFTYTTGVIVNDYDDNLVRTIPAALTTIQRPTSAATVGQYALFAGGENSSGDTVSTIEAYEAFAAEIPIPSFSKYYFDGVTESEKTTILGTTLKSAIPLTGYIEKITELSGTMSVN